MVNNSRLDRWIKHFLCCVLVSTTWRNINVLTVAIEGHFILLSGCRSGFSGLESPAQLKTTESNLQLETEEMPLYIPFTCLLFTEEEGEPKYYLQAEARTVGDIVSQVFIKLNILKVMLSILELSLSSVSVNCSLNSTNITQVQLLFWIVLSWRLTVWISFYWNTEQIREAEDWNRQVWVLIIHSSAVKLKKQRLSPFMLLQCQQVTH